MVRSDYEYLSDLGVLLLLERLHEVLGLGVVVGRPHAAHARLDLVFGAGVLHPAIGVVNEGAGAWAALGQRHLERGDLARWRTRADRHAKLRPITPGYVE